MSRKPLLMVVLSALCALMFLAAGCGGGDDESSNGATPAAASSGSKSSKPAVSGGSLKNCKEFEQAAQEVGQQFASAISGSGGNADLQRAAKLFDELTSKAPAEIKPDFETINNAFGKLAEALEGVDLSGNKAPDQATLAKLQKVTSEIDQQKLSAAGAHITAWAQKNCKA
jgi:cell fate (sporulation/competence/biofilm development) regulator YlbF (YheA/YmcA/DUF963 family)